MPDLVNEVDGPRLQYVFFPKRSEWLVRHTLECCGGEGPIYSAKIWGYTDSSV